MFTVAEKDISLVLEDFGILPKIRAFTELQRYHYEKGNPESKEVRLIIRVDLDHGQSVVIRFKNESDVTLELINAQSQFANLLASYGVETPRTYTTNGQYARWYCINGYNVIVTVEDYVNGELHVVDDVIAEKTGRLLAQMHNIAEAANFHVQNEVLFHPLKNNDLFSFQAFDQHKDFLLAQDQALYQSIVQEYTHAFHKVQILGNEPQYAVQGDISNCNLYQTAEGRIGVFDFNRCGDNTLYYDAVMQGIFEARLMDYPKEILGKQESTILAAFFKGYHKERPFSDQQREVFPYLYAIISAFWLCDIKWSQNSLSHAIEMGDTETAHKWMQEIYKRILFRPEMPI